MSNMTMEKIMGVISNHEGTIAGINSRAIAFLFPSGDHKSNCKREISNLKIDDFLLVKMNHGRALGLIFNTE